VGNPTYVGCPHDQTHISRKRPIVVSKSFHTEVISSAKQWMSHMQYASSAYLFYSPKSRARINLPIQVQYLFLLVVRACRRESRICKAGSSRCMASSLVIMWLQAKHVLFHDWPLDMWMIQKSAKPPVIPKMHTDDNLTPIAEPVTH